MTLCIHGDKGNKLILELLYASQQINQDALKQPQFPDDTLIINETSSVLSIFGRELFQFHIKQEQCNPNKQITK